MRHLHRLLQILLAPGRGLVALCQLPAQLRQFRTQLQTQEALVRETNDLLRELLLGIGQGPRTPETPHMDNPPPDRLQLAPPPESRDPHRLRTARDVTYSSRQFLHEQDASAAAEQAPWRRPR